jgi:hypothetical protein
MATSHCHHDGGDGLIPLGDTLEVMAALMLIMFVYVLLELRYSWLPSHCHWGVSYLTTSYYQYSETLYAALMVMS